MNPSLSISTEAKHIRVLLRRQGRKEVAIAQAPNTGPATPYILHQQASDSRMVRGLSRHDRARVLPSLWDQLIDAGIAPEGSVAWMARLPLAEAIRLGEACERSSRRRRRKKPKTLAITSNLAVANKIAPWERELLLPFVTRLVEDVVRASDGADYGVEQEQEEV